MLYYTPDDLVLGLYHLIKAENSGNHFQPHVQLWQDIYDVGSKRNGSSESMNMSITNICNWILSTRAKKVSDTKNFGNTHEGLNLTNRKLSHVEPAMKNPTCNHQFNIMLKLTQYWLAYC
jgi:hypothetical protein